MWIQKPYLPFGNHSAVGASNSIPLGHDMAWQILAKWSESSARTSCELTWSQTPSDAKTSTSTRTLVTLHHQQVKHNCTHISLHTQRLVSAIQLALNNFRLWNHLRRSQHKMPSTTSEMHQTRPEHGIHIYLFINGLCMYLSILCLFIYYV